MAHVNTVAPGRLQGWIKKIIKQRLPSSTWDQFSNRFEVTQSVPSAKNMVMPTTVVTKITDEFRMGQYSTTMLSIRKPAMAAIGGPNSAEGKESKPTTKTVTVYYTNQRFPITLGDMSVMGNMEEFYNYAEYNVGVIGDLFVMQTDYDHQRSVIAGCDQFLSDSTAWESSEYGSEISKPLSDVLHPNLYYWLNGALTKNTWDVTYATAVTTLATAIDTEMDSGDACLLACLDAVQLKAQRTIIPIGGVGGNSEVQYVVKISDAQMYDLATDTTTNASFRDLLKYTEKGFDRMFTGYCGVYKGMMIIVDQSCPLFNVSGSTAGAFQYNTPLSDGRTRVTKGSDTGTAEVGMLFGRGAIGLVDKMEMDLVRKGRDYDFVKSICGHRQRGTQRLDLDTTVAATTSRVNETSLIFLTATMAATV